MQDREDLLLFGGREGPGRRRSAPAAGRARLALAIVGRPGTLERRTEGPNPQRGPVVGDRLDHDGALGASGGPKSAATFF